MKVADAALVPLPNDIEPALHRPGGPIAAPDKHIPRRANVVRVPFMIHAQHVLPVVIHRHVLAKQHDRFVSGLHVNRHAGGKTVVEHLAHVRRHQLIFQMEDVGLQVLPGVLRRMDAGVTPREIQHAKARGRGQRGGAQQQENHKHCCK